VSNRYFALQEFFLTYFHPDWRQDDSSRGGVVQKYLRVASPKDVEDVQSDLQALLDEPLDEHQLHNKVLGEYSLSYDPWREKISMREWLEGLARDLTTTV
jgi:hypothetical protein